MESTRVDGIERIFMLFGKMAAPIDFKYRPYEACLSDVLITHSPRYAIDMELEEGKTIFDRIGKSYSEVRNLAEPFKPFKDLYKNNVKPGQKLWWLDENQSQIPILRIWNTISKEEQQSLLIKGLILYPEVVSKGRQTKYYNFSLWLAKEHNVICNNVRDLFSAGGKVEVHLEGKSYKNVPRVIFNLFQNLHGIKQGFDVIDLSLLSEYWEMSIKNYKQAKMIWVDKICQSVLGQFSFGEFNLQNFLSDELL